MTAASVRLSVKDSGVGFDSQTEEKLFEPFYSTKADGMGIGLSVSRSIMESHQGGFGQSGTKVLAQRFCFLFRVAPILKSNRRATSAAAFLLHEAARRGDAFQRPLVAVVDDDESVRESLPDLLGEFGFCGKVFSSAEEFLTSGIVGQMKCLVSDIVMPGMTGLDLQQELKVRGHKIPIIFITAQKDETFVGER